MGHIKNKHFNRLETLQNRAIIIMNYESYRETNSPSYKESIILSLLDNIRLQNFLYVLDDINNNLPPALNNTFQLTSTSHDYATRSSLHVKLEFLQLIPLYMVSEVKTTVYDLRSQNHCIWFKKSKPLYMV